MSAYRIKHRHIFRRHIGYRRDDLSFPVIGCSLIAVGGIVHFVSIYIVIIHHPAAFFPFHNQASRRGRLLCIILIKVGILRGTDIVQPDMARLVFYAGQRLFQIRIPGALFRQHMDRNVLGQLPQKRFRLLRQRIKPVFRQIKGRILFRHIIQSQIKRHRQYNRHYDSGNAVRAQLNSAPGNTVTPLLNALRRTEKGKP